MFFALCASACGAREPASIPLELPNTSGAKSAVVALTRPISNLWVGLAAVELGGEAIARVPLAEVEASESGPELMMTVLLYSAPLDVLSLEPGPLIPQRSGDDPLDPTLPEADQAYRARLQGRSLSSFDAIDDDSRLRSAVAPEREAIQPIAGAAYKLTVAHSMLCLSVANTSTSSGARLVQSTCEPPERVWELVDAGAPFFALRARHSGKCAEASTSFEARHVTQEECSGAASQAWRFEPRGDQSFGLISRAHGRCMDVVSGQLTEGSPIIHYECQPSANQRWYLTPVP